MNNFIRPRQSIQIKQFAPSFYICSDPSQEKIPKQFAINVNMASWQQRFIAVLINLCECVNSK